jgi:DNA adenine methylase
VQQLCYVLCGPSARAASLPLVPSEPIPMRKMLDAWERRVAEARPFLRWAGGKQSFLYRYADRIPLFSGAYIEPFLGSGAVFFFIARTRGVPGRVQLGDINKHLVRTFLAIRDRPADVHDRLVALQAGYSAASDKSEYYYEIRERHNALHPRTDPATFLFLNRTCWNGLYRVNQLGRFNVPYGAPKTEDVVPTLEELLNAAAALVRADIRATTWQNTVALAEPGAFVFLDPPYYSDVIRDDSKYQTRRFGLKQHEELGTMLSRLADRGVSFLLTNSGEAEMVDLYSRHGLTVELVQLPRAINSKADRRTRVPELVVTPPADRVRRIDVDAEILLLPDQS